MPGYESGEQKRGIQQGSSHERKRSGGRGLRLNLTRRAVELLLSIKTTHHEATLYAHEDQELISKFNVHLFFFFPREEPDKVSADARLS